MKKSETGSAHVIVIGVLIVALIGALGFIFWQNIINKPTQSTTATTTQSVSPSPSVAASKSFCAPLEKLCFDYPSNWSVKTDDISDESGALAEQFTISDNQGKPWLRLQTGMTGIGGACGGDDGSYTKVLKTHTTGITESSTKTAVYAVSFLQYNAGLTDTKKFWTVNMALNDSKASQNVGKIGLCDLGINIITGRNAKTPDASGVGAVGFGYYIGSANADSYASEAEASAALTSDSASKAYAILQSAHYE